MFSGPEPDRVPMQWAHMSANIVFRSAIDQQKKNIGERPFVMMLKEGNYNELFTFLNEARLTGESKQR